MAAIGKWRKHSRRIIAEVLWDLPADAALATRKAVLRAAYPFGQREDVTKHECSLERLSHAQAR